LDKVMQGARIPLRTEGRPSLTVSSFNAALL
jgi:hypothetical protein